MQDADRYGILYVVIDDSNQHKGTNDEREILKQSGSQKSLRNSSRGISVSSATYQIQRRQCTLEV